MNVFFFTFSPLKKYYNSGQVYCIAFEYLSIYLFIYLFICYYLSIYQSIVLYIYFFLCLSRSKPIYLFTYLSADLFSLSINAFIYWSIYIFIYWSIYIFIYWSIYIFISPMLGLEGHWTEPSMICRVKDD